MTTDEIQHLAMVASISHMGNVGLYERSDARMFNEPVDSNSSSMFLLKRCLRRGLISVAALAATGLMSCTTVEQPKESSSAPDLRERLPLDIGRQAQISLLSKGIAAEVLQVTDGNQTAERYFVANGPWELWITGAKWKGLSGPKDGSLGALVFDTTSGALDSIVLGFAKAMYLFRNDTAVPEELAITVIDSVERERADVQMGAIRWSKDVPSSKAKIRGVGLVKLRDAVAWTEKRIDTSQLLATITWSKQGESLQQTSNTSE